MISNRPHHWKLRPRFSRRGRMLSLDPIKISDREKRLVENFVNGPWGSKSFRLAAQVERDLPTERPIEQHPEFRTITRDYGSPPFSKYLREPWRESKSGLGYTDRLRMLLLLGIAILAAVGGIHFLTRAIEHFTR